MLLVESAQSVANRLEWTKRFPDLPSPQCIEADTDAANAARFMIKTGAGCTVSTLAFAGTRRGRGGRQPDTSGAAFRLTFGERVIGPIALGWGAHFGMGLFGAS